jgi:hypothetical protein
MKKHQLVALLFFLLTFPNFIFSQQEKTCTEWKSHLLADGTDSNLSMRFCNLSESGNAFFEIKNDTELDSKLMYQINFKNGKNTIGEVIIPLDDKVRIHFEDKGDVYQSGITSWKFDKIQYRKRGGFKTAK